MSGFESYNAKLMRYELLLSIVIKRKINIKDDVVVSFTLIR